MKVFKKVFYILLIFLLTITLFLTFFEFLVHTFQKPMGFEIIDSHTHFITWMYLLKQQYMSFIDLDIYDIHEKRHLLDVKRILKMTYQLWILLLSLSIFFLIFLRGKLKLIMKKIGLLGLSITLLLLLSSLSFIESFNFLHALFFKHQTWVFSDDSTLISLFPMIYFKQFFFCFLVGTMLCFFTLNHFTQVEDNAPKKLDE